MKTKVLLLLIICMGKIAHADTPATHGMLLFGDKATYASHLPMFHKPHDYQLIMKLSLMDASGLETIKAYELVKKSGETLFTIVPETMDLTLIINGSKKSFSAALFQGHFERGGKNLGPITVNVDKIVFSKKLDPSEVEDSLDYLIFGEQSEYFAAHIVKGKPSFDTILKVSQAQQVTHHFCGRGSCLDPSQNPIADTQLPILASMTTAGEKPVPAIKGEQLGGLDAFTEVLNVIYSEEAELSH